MKILKYKTSKNTPVITSCLGSLGFGLLFVSCALFFSCEDFVEVDLPNDQINGETVFDNTGTATAALTNIYAELRNNTGIVSGDSFNGMSSLMGHYADELELFSLNQIQPFNINTLLPTDGTVSNIWDNAYNNIFASNTVIEGVNNSKSISQEEKEQLIGEALFIRAFVHFYLVNLFGEIPYIKTTDFEKNREASKMNVAEVYESIILDLLEAKDLLTNDYVSGERTRPNRATVSALLARVYLYKGDWENAETESSSIIENTALYVWETDLSRVFLRESTSAIWQFSPSSTTGINNTLEGFTFIFVTAPPPLMALNNSVIAAFETGDNRFDNWVEAVTDGTDTFYHSFKYKENTATPAPVEYSVIFRLAEQYLIRAEARTQLGDIAGAQQDVNIIRNRAGLDNTTATTTNELLDAILQERRVELFTEHGHRFFDLKRTGRTDAVLGPVKSGWDATDILLPIPESEILVNPNLLPQNPGY